MLDIPYGQSYFPIIRRDRMLYVDKTRHIRLLEVPARSFVVFLRPRRFGKSTLLSTLQHYYDRNYADRFDALFGGLDISRDPTPKRNGYLTLRLEFTGINTDGTAADCQRSVYRKLRNTIHGFCHDYQALIPTLAPFAANLGDDGYPAELLDRLLGLLRSAGLPLYLLVDEYDNFTNSLIAHGREQLYLDITHDGGFMRELYKTFKAAMATGAIERIFLTGVSPVTLDDITSGANIFTNLSQQADLAAMVGFTQGEVEALVDRALAQGSFTLDRLAVLDDLRRFYNGYRFSDDAPEPVYNTDMVLYFLMHLRPPARYPREILDNNLRIDYDKLKSLLYTPARELRGGALETLRSALETREVTAQVHESFPLQRAYHGDHFASLLYYLGMLTLPPPGSPGFRLVVPNEVIRQLCLESFGQLIADLVKTEVASPQLEGAVRAMAYSGDPAPFLELLQTRVLCLLSRRDTIKLDERSVKFIAMAFLCMTDLFLPFSEMEHVGGFSDLLLPVNRRRYPDASYSWMLEFKYRKVADSKPPKEKKSRAPAAAARPAGVEGALAEAEQQLGRYLQDPRLVAFAGPKGWRSVAVCSVGHKGLYFREPHQQTQAVR